MGGLYLESMASENSNINDFFGTPESFSLTELLCLKIILNKLRVKGSKILMSEISYGVFAYYWKIKFNVSNNKYEIKEFNDIRGELTRRYGLSMYSSIEEIEQMLTFAHDKHIDIKLFSIIKASMYKLSDRLQNKGQNKDVTEQLKTLGLFKKKFFKVYSIEYIEVNATWCDYFKHHEEYIQWVDEKIQIKLRVFPKDLDKEDSTRGKKIDRQPNSVRKNDYSGLVDIEKRTSLQMYLNKTPYQCIEEALLWLKVDQESYQRIHGEYTDYLSEKEIKNTVNKFPLVTAIMLIYTAIYRYDDEDASGF